MITTIIYAIVAYFIGNVMGGKLLEKIYKEEFKQFQKIIKINNF